MFKRSTKITSLLVAAASVATMVPAMAADYKKVESHDGTVYKAVAYKDGTFYIDGDLEDQEEGVYYLKDGKYTELDDVDSGDDARDYSNKYVEIGEKLDGDYYLDLENGKVTDDSIADDDIDDAVSALRKALRKDDPADRYLKEESAGGFLSLKDKNEVEYVSTAAFDESYYEFKYDVNPEKKAKDKNGNADSFTVYSDIKGNYIDADYKLGKINVVRNGQVKALVNTNDDKEFNDGVKVRAAIRHISTLAQDKDYIYRLAELTVNVENATFGSKENKYSPEVGVTSGSAVTYDTTGGAVALDDAGKTTKNLVIQKISKASDGDVDGAKTPKTVETYFVTNNKNNETGKLAYKAEDLIGRSFTAVDGNLVAYIEDRDNDQIKAQTIKLKSVNGYYFTDFDGDDTIDVDKDDNGDYAISIDKDGNLWVLDNGSIKMFDKDEFKKVYKVDGSFTKLSVYDKDNMIAWSQDDEVYSIIGGKSSSDNEEETTTDAATTNTWVQDATTGAWSYVKADGTKAIGWLQSPASGLWYYMDANGVMMSNGWINDNGTWYYLTESGAMKTGWLNDRGTWYYLQANGAMKTGWLNDNGTWYYLNASGAMLANTTVDGYVLGANGAWIK